MNGPPGNARVSTQFLSFCMNCPAVMNTRQTTRVKIGLNLGFYVFWASLVGENGSLHENGLIRRTSCWNYVV